MGVWGVSSILINILGVNQLPESVDEEHLDSPIVSRAFKYRVNVNVDEAAQIVLDEFLVLYILNVRRLDKVVLHVPNKNLFEVEKVCDFFLASIILIFELETCEEIDSCLKDLKSAVLITSISDILEDDFP